MQYKSDCSYAGLCSVAFVMRQHKLQRPGIGLITKRRPPANALGRFGEKKFQIQKVLGMQVNALGQRSTGQVSLRSIVRGASAGLPKA